MSPTATLRSGAKHKQLGNLVFLGQHTGNPRWGLLETQIMIKEAKPKPGTSPFSLLLLTRWAASHKVTRSFIPDVFISLCCLLIHTPSYQNISGYASIEAQSSWVLSGRWEAWHPRAVTSLAHKNKVKQVLTTAVKLDVRISHTWESRKGSAKIRRSVPSRKHQVTDYSVQSSSHFRRIILVYCGYITEMTFQFLGKFWRANQRPK